MFARTTILPTPSLTITSFCLVPHNKPFIPLTPIKLYELVNNMATDWIKGQTKRLYDIALPKGYHLEGYATQHESNEVTVNQSVSMIWGIFNLASMQIKPPKELGNINFMDKLNHVLQWERKA